MMVHQVTQPFQAWHNDGKLQHAPAWVRRCCVIVDGAVFHKRRSGMQIVNTGEYMVCDLDGAVVFYTPAEFVLKFERRPA